MLIRNIFPFIWIIFIDLHIYSTVLWNLRMVGWSTLPLRTADSLSVKRNLQLRTSNVPPICTADLKCSVNLAYSDAVELRFSSYGSSSDLFNKLICLFISFHYMRRMFFRKKNADFQDRLGIYLVFINWKKCVRGVSKVFIAKISSFSKLLITSLEFRAN